MLIPVIILGAILGAFEFLHRWMREGSKRQCERMGGVDSEIKKLRSDVSDFKVSAAKDLRLMSPLGWRT